MRLPFAQVDVFSQRPYLGNPVAVVLDAGALSTEQMQRIARWTNLSETTFVLPAQHDKADYRLRIFDPANEMPFAGHPTLGSAFAVLNAGLRPRDSDVLVQECGVGLVRIHRDAATGALAFEAPQARFLSGCESERAAIAAALQLAPQDLGEVCSIDVGPIWITVELASPAHVLALAPDFAALTALSQRLRVEGATVFARYHEPAAVQYEVRSFAPASSVPEDPVCGSGNACVANLLKRRGVHASYVAGQGQRLGRDGQVRVTFRDDAILIGGEAVLCITGTILCPDGTSA